MGVPATVRRRKLNTSKWMKRLRREATANPKKAAILGLLLLVAAYYWTPLVAGWFSGSGTPKPPAAGTAPAQSPVSGIAATATPPANSPAEYVACPWQTLIQWRKADPRTVATTDLASRRDPFRLTESQRMEIVEKPVEQAPEPKPVETAQSLGLQLSSTIVGPGRRLAIINGRTYQLGQVLELSRDGAPLVLRLAEVGPRWVVLQTADQRLELTIPQRAMSGRLELVRSRD